MTEQKTIPQWLQDEVKAIKTTTNYEQLPALKLISSEITEFDVDLSKQWEKWQGEDAKGKQITKKIIPVTHV